MKREQMIRHRKNIPVIFTALLITLTASLNHSCSTSDSFIKKDINFNSYKQLGIIVRPTRGLTEKDARSVATDVVGIELAKKGYIVVERALRKEIIEEQGIKMTGLYDEEPSELGKLKSIKALLIISFPRYALLRNRQDGTSVNIIGAGIKMGGKDLIFTEVAATIRIVSVKTGEMIYMATSDRKLRGSRLRSATRTVVKNCLENLPRI